MKSKTTKLDRTIALAAFAFSLGGISTVDAQTAAPALPTAPGAQRAGEGGMTGAAASLPGGPNGASPLEPYLVTWLLPASGLIAILTCWGVDRRMRQGHTSPPMV